MPGATNKPSTSASADEVTKELETWFEKVTNGKDGEITKQMVVGGVSGWLTGFLAMKVGKAAATAVGGGILLLQVANHKGYININWNRLNKDVEKLSKEIQKEAGSKSETWGNKLEKKLDNAADKAEKMINKSQSNARRWYQKITYGEDFNLKKMQIFSISYAAGVAIGLFSAQ